MSCLNKRSKKDTNFQKMYDHVGGGMGHAEEYAVRGIKAKNRGFFKHILDRKV